MSKFTKTSNKLSLLDSNILVFAHNVSSPLHEKAKQLIFSAVNKEINAVITPKNILEFYSIITNPTQVEKPLLINDVYFLANEYIRSGTFAFIYPQTTTLFKTIQLATKYQIKKAEIFDAYLVATMLDNSVSTIYTDNEKHFNLFERIEVVNPFK